MKRQGLQVTIGELRRIADELEEELKEAYAKANCHYPEYVATYQQLHQINIVNEEGLSDTWRLENKPIAQNNKTKPKIQDLQVKGSAQSD